LAEGGALDPGARPGQLRAVRGELAPVREAAVLADLEPEMLPRRRDPLRRERRRERDGEPQRQERSGRAPGAPARRRGFTPRRRAGGNASAPGFLPPAWVLVRGTVAAARGPAP